MALSKNLKNLIVLLTILFSSGCQHKFVNTKIIQLTSIKFNSSISNSLKERSKQYFVAEKISNAIDSLNPFEEKKDFFATSILSESSSFQFDNEGRISLTQKLLKHAKIRHSMLFVGQGKTFQIWEPTAFEKFRVTAKRKSNIHRASLRWERQFNN